MNFEPKLNKSENCVENNKINLSPLKNGKDEIKSKENLENNYNLPCKLDFYTTGKVDNYPEIYIKKCNNSFRSSSNNLLMRNYLSVNSPKYEDIKEKKLKKYMTVFHQDLDNNNYLDPYKPFKSNHYYDLPNYSINQEMYNVIKKKLYIKGDLSNIKKGKEITKFDFLSKKQKLIHIKDKNFSSSTQTINTIRGKFFNKMKQFEPPLNINEKKNEEKENNCDNLIKEKFVKKRIISNLSENAFKPINPFDSQNEELKSINIHIERTHNKILKSRNWWKAE